MCSGPAGQVPPGTPVEFTWVTVDATGAEVAAPAGSDCWLEARVTAGKASYTACTSPHVPQLALPAEACRLHVRPANASSTDGEAVASFEVLRALPCAADAWDCARPTDEAQRGACGHGHEPCCGRYGALCSCLYACAPCAAACAEAGAPPWREVPAMRTAVHPTTSCQRSPRCLPPADEERHCVEDTLFCLVFPIDSEDFIVDGYDRKPSLCLPLPEGCGLPGATCCPPVRGASRPWCADGASNASCAQEDDLTDYFSTFFLRNASLYEQLQDPGAALPQQLLDLYGSCTAESSGGDGSACDGGANCAPGSTVNVTACGMPGGPCGPTLCPDNPYCETGCVRGIIGSVNASRPDCLQPGSATPLHACSRRSLFSLSPSWQPLLRQLQLSRL